MTSFASLSRAEQRYNVESVLPKVLAGIDRVTPTVIIVARVARALETDPAWVTGLVISIAKEGHPCAHRDGETFKRYGRTMRRWNWYPLADGAKTPEKALPVGKIEAMLTQSGAVDTSEW